MFSYKYWCVSNGSSSIFSQIARKVVPTMELDHSKRYSLEEAINLIVSSPNTIAPSTANAAHPITESEIDFITDASGAATKANDDPLDPLEENLNFFPSVQLTMFTDASTDTKC